MTRILTVKSAFVGAIVDLDTFVPPQACPKSLGYLRVGNNVTGQRRKVPPGQRKDPRNVWRAEVITSVQHLPLSAAHFVAARDWTKKIHACAPFRFGCLSVYLFSG